MDYLFLFLFLGAEVTIKFNIYDKLNFVKLKIIIFYSLSLKEILASFSTNYILFT